MACAEERLGIDALDAPLAELVPGEGVNCTGLQAFRRGKVTCVDEMGVPEVLSEKDRVDVRKRNIRVGRSEDICYGFGQGIEYVVKDLASCDGGRAFRKALSSHEEGMETAVEFGKQGLKVKG